MIRKFNSTQEMINYFSGNINWAHGHGFLCKLYQGCFYWQTCVATGQQYPDDSFIPRLAWHDREYFDTIPTPVLDSSIRYD